MSSLRTKSPTLSDDELAELFTLAQDADSVELKLTIPEAGQRSAVTALEVDPLDAQIRQVFFFDTPDLRLYEQGVVVRARRVQKKGDDSVIKLRPVVPAELPKKLRRSANFVVEVDAMPGGYVCSGSLKGTPGREVRQTIASHGALRKLFSKEQRAFYETYAPDDVSLDDLTVLGPLFVLKLKFAPADFSRRLVAEMWLYPDGSRVLELSTKCSPGDAFQAAAEARAFLTGKGVSLAGKQETKTRKALQFFAREAQSS
jgi:hypothetical protein